MSDMYYGWYAIPVLSGLTQGEKEFNARKMMTFLMNNGFTKWAAAATTGNAWAESQMNPGRFQGGTAYSGGYGLMQWDPYTKYSEWAGPDWENNGPLECERLIYEREHGLQFYPRPPWTQWTYRKYCAFEPEEGLTDNETINMLTSVWVYDYLMPADPERNMANRQYHSRYVFYHCSGTSLPPWLLMKWSQQNRRLF